jgi:hypothetical protein
MKRSTMLVALSALVAALAVLAGVRLYPSSSPDIGLAAPAGDLICSVKASCGAGEVAVFKMSGLANAHAGTAGASAYANTVCCSGPAGLSNACSGYYDTALTLSAADNAHAAVDGSYPTDVCLSAPTMPDCTYGDTCGPAYACLATVSGANNAHIADCDGAGDYPTKVCCKSCKGGPTNAGPSAPDAAGDCDFDLAFPGVVGDGCVDSGGTSTNEADLGLDDTDPWDFFSVPLPALFAAADPTVAFRDYRVMPQDAQAVFAYFGNGNANSAGDPGYEADLNLNGVKDGWEYDRSIVGPGMTGPPNGMVAPQDAQAAFAQFAAGFSCSSGYDMSP